MYNTVTVDQIKLRQACIHGLVTGIATMEAASQFFDFESCTSQFDTFFAVVYAVIVSTMPRKLSSIGSNTGTNFQHLFALPQMKASKLWNMRLYLEPTSRYFFKEIQTANFVSAVSNVARLIVPVLFDAFFQC